VADLVVCILTESLFCVVNEGYTHAFHVKNEFNQMCNMIQVNTTKLLTHHVFLKKNSALCSESQASQPVGQEGGVSIDPIDTGFVP